MCCIVYLVSLMFSLFHFLSLLKTCSQQLKQEVKVVCSIFIKWHTMLCFNLLWTSYIISVSLCKWSTHAWLWEGVAGFLTLSCEIAVLLTENVWAKVWRTDPTTISWAQWCVLNDSRKLQFFSMLIICKTIWLKCIII